MTSLAILLAAMFLHELGHASCALVFGVKVYRIGFCWRGMFTAMDMPTNRAEFFFVTLAGPLTSLAFFLLACLEGWNVFALSNLCIIATGMLPNGDFWRLFQYSGLRTRARINARLMECGRVA
jgi:Zn-dependent protease